MANFMDYLDWRGELTVKQSPFNSIDHLILSTLAYIDFEQTGFDLSGRSTVTIKEAGEKFSLLHADEKMNLGRVIPDEVFVLFDVLSRSRRFCDMKLSYYVNQIDELEEKQFSAITVELGDGNFCIAFRGTDDTIVGWKEDFNMCFQSPVPSQIQAVEYLHQVALAKRGKIYMGGHSKGGNLAIYAATCCHPFVRHRIRKVCSFDSPGFTQEILQRDSYKAIADRIQRVVPQSSMIGILFEHEAQYDVVASTQIGLFQHDMFSWQVLGNDFVYVDDISASSTRVEYAMKEFIYAMSVEERQKFVEALFYVFEETGAKTLSQLKIKEVIAILRRMNKEDNDNRKILSQALRLMVQILEEYSQQQLLKQAEKQMEKMKILPRKKQL
ncbi:MAG: DUF2974 domain-containing protein [Lachnospiraceae bacterium]|nr:DUF2974 domain-containing protein [Lachnospiraceae bacterium]